MCSNLLTADLQGATVADVLADPYRYCDKSLADPIEGVTYGRTTAKVYVRDGVPWINSFAHGGVQYTLVPEFKRSVLLRLQYRRIARQLSADQWRELSAGRPIIGSAGGSAGGAGGAGTGWTGASAAGASPSAMGLLLPPIYVGPGELPRVVDEAEDALLKFDHEIYQRGGKLVRPILNVIKASGDREFQDWRLIDVTRPYLVDQLSGAAQFLQHDKRAKKHRNYRSAGQSRRYLPASAKAVGKLPRIAGFASAPFLHADGTIHDWEGYDPISGLLCKWDQAFPPIPPMPDKAEAMAALARLKEPLAEFPFVTGADKAAALSAILTAVDRRGMDIAPLHAFTAPAPGTGKGLLVNVIAVIATGKPVFVINQSSRDDEFTKGLGAELLGGASLIAIDNCQHVLENSLLNIAITQPVFGVRVLGLSQNLPVINNATIFANGNNLIIGADLTRRTIRCEMDATWSVRSNASSRTTVSSKLSKPIAPSSSSPRLLCCAPGTSPGQT